MRSPLVILAVLALAACRDPRAEANIAQAVLDVGTEINAMRQDYALLQWQVDSLRQVAARQDSVLGRLSAMVGLPYTPR